MRNWDSTLVLVLAAIIIAAALLCYRLGGWGKTWGAAVVAGCFLGATLILWQTSKADLPLWFMLAFSIIGPAALFVSWRYVLPRYEK